MDDMRVVVRVVERIAELAQSNRSVRPSQRLFTLLIAA